MNYSIVIPAYNEEKNLPVLIEEIENLRKRLKGGVEVIIIDDGSTDRTLKVLKHLKRKFSYIKVIRFDRNCGQTAGFDAGFKIGMACGEIIITMDADLQNDPRDILKLLKYYPEYDVISGVREKRRDNIVKIISSKIANSVRNFITNDKIKDTGCSLKIYKSEYLKKLKLFNGLHRFLPTLLKMEGARVIEVPVSHRNRRFGHTHYGILNRVFKALIDAFAVRWMKKRFLDYKIESKEF